MTPNDEKLKDSLLVGHAVYLEFVLPHSIDTSVFQMLICPEAQSKVTPTLKTPAITYRRQLSAGGPKKQWRYLSPSHSSFLPESTAEMRREFINQTIERLHTRGFRVHKQPIVVQVSEKDLEDIIARNTPYKLIGRVLKVRRKHGFPTTFIK
ncbi:MAG: hypothetical protein EBS91_00075 [Betaproteobacteria bacterium]|nr:hypothetical protein [Betaproteobacteria bacterium]NCA23032.1 hypothetical protein [Betaproteobacteria bacterium]